MLDLCHFGVYMKALLNTIREEIDNIHTEQYKKLGGYFHFHSPIELLCVRQGAAKVWIGDTEAIVNKNEIAVVLSYEAHRFLSTEDGGEYFILFISPSMCPEFMEAVRNKNAHNPIVRNPNDSIKYAIDALSGENINAIEKSGYAHILLGSLLRQIELVDAADKRSDSLSTKLFFYINEHYKEEISLEKIAQVMGYDRHYLSKCFRANFQMSIGDYINTLRLKNAVVLMRDRRKSITEVAMESGFGSMRTFYRTFSEEFGCSPCDYLKREM